MQYMYFRASRLPSKPGQPCAKTLVKKLLLRPRAQKKIYHDDHKGGRSACTCVCRIVSYAAYNYYIMVFMLHSVMRHQYAYRETVAAVLICFYYPAVVYHKSIRRSFVHLPHVRSYVCCGHMRLCWCLSAVRDVISHLECANVEGRTCGWVPLGLHDRKMKLTNTSSRVASETKNHSCACAPCAYICIRKYNYYCCN